MRRPAFAAAWGLLLSACALDMSGLGAPLPADDTGATAPPREAAAADQSVALPEGIEAGDDDAVAPEASPGPEDGDASSSMVDAVSTADAGLDSPTGVGPGCDEDGDGYLAMTSACGGNDCCDEDKHVHPGQTAYFTDPGACGGYDYDCDGKESPEYGAANCQWSTFSCNGDGFAAPIPACGASSGRTRAAAFPGTTCC